LRATSIEVTRVVRLADQAQPVEVVVVRRDRGYEQVGLGLIGLVGRPHVQRGGQRGDQHGEPDQLGPFADRLDVAPQAALLLGRSKPIGGLCLGVDFHEIWLAVLAVQRH
jgi:hypothetical protein